MASGKNVPVPIRKHSSFKKHKRKNHRRNKKINRIKKMKIINPATEETIKEIKEDDQFSLEKKLNSLQSAQIDWQKKPLQERVQLLKSFSILLEKNIEPLASTL